MWTFLTWFNGGKNNYIQYGILLSFKGVFVCVSWLFYMLALAKRTVGFPSSDKRFFVLI